MVDTRIPRQSELDQFYVLLPTVDSRFKYVFPDAPVYELPSGEAAVGINARALNADDELTWWLQVPPDVDGWLIHVKLHGAGATVIPTVFTGTISVGTHGLYEFKIPKADMVEGIVEVYANLTDPNSGHSELTPKLKAKIDLQAPGGPVDPPAYRKTLHWPPPRCLLPGKLMRRSCSKALPLQSPLTPG